MKMDSNFNPENIEKDIRALLSSSKLHISKHARERIEQRSIIMSDVLHLLKYEHVEPQRQKATIRNMSWHQHKLWRYAITGYTPNSDRRRLQSIVIIPDEKGGIKIVTIMWQDERI